MARYKIKPADGSRSSRKRVGRGAGSGKGKTAGKGTKGQKSRTGYTYRAWFEGGQMPLQRRVPKRGFKNPFRTSYQVVNLGDLARVGGSEIDKQALKDAGLIAHADKPVKILGDGDLKGTVDVTADAFSGSARRAIEEAGGTATVLEGRKKYKRKRTKAPKAAAAPAVEQEAPEGEKAEEAETPVEEAETSAEEAETSAEEAETPAEPEEKAEEAEAEEQAEEAEAPAEEAVEADEATEEDKDSE